MDQAARLRSWVRDPGTNRPRRSAAEAAARVIVVTSGKGGVGKSNVAVNLGIYLAQSGMRVGILDADMGLANVDLLLGLTPRYHLSHVLSGEKRLTDIGMEGPSGLVVYPGGPGLAELANLSQWRLERFVTRIAELDRQLDLLLIDTGAGIGHTVTAFVRSVKEILLVTTPEPTAIRDAYAIAKTGVAGNSDVRIHLVVNMATLREAEGVCAKLNMMATRFLVPPLQMELLGHIPLDERVVRSVIEQTPFILAYPGTKASRALTQIAARLYGGKPAPKQGIAALFRRFAIRTRRGAD